VDLDILDFESLDRADLDTALLPRDDFELPEADRWLVDGRELWEEADKVRRGLEAERPDSELLDEERLEADRSGLRDIFDERVLWDPDRLEYFEECDDRLAIVAPLMLERGDEDLLEWLEWDRLEELIERRLE
jgi:hypothetical protein